MIYRKTLLLYLAILSVQEAGSQRLDFNSLNPLTWNWDNIFSAPSRPQYYPNPSNQQAGPLANSIRAVLFEAVKGLERFFTKSEFIPSVSNTAVNTTAAATTSSGSSKSESNSGESKDKESKTGESNDKESDSGESKDKESDSGESNDKESNGDASESDDGKDSAGSEDDEYEYEESEEYEYESDDDDDDESGSGEQGEDEEMGDDIEQVVEEGSVTKVSDSSETSEDGDSESDTSDTSGKDGDSKSDSSDTSTKDGDPQSDSSDTSQDDGSQYYVALRKALGQVGLRPVGQAVPAVQRDQKPLGFPYLNSFLRPSLSLQPFPDTSHMTPDFALPDAINLNLNFPSPFDGAMSTDDMKSAFGEKSSSLKLVQEVVGKEEDNSTTEEETQGNATQQATATEAAPTTTIDASNLIPYSDEWIALVSKRLSENIAKLEGNNKEGKGKTEKEEEDTDAEVDQQNGDAETEAAGTNEKSIGIEQTTNANQQTTEVVFVLPTTEATEDVSDDGEELTLASDIKEKDFDKEKTELNKSKPVLVPFPEEWVSRVSNYLTKNLNRLALTESLSQKKTIGGTEGSTPDSGVSTEDDPGAESLETLITDEAQMQTESFLATTTAKVRDVAPSEKITNGPTHRSLAGFKPRPIIIDEDMPFKESAENQVTQASVEASTTLKTLSSKQTRVTRKIHTTTASPTTTRRPTLRELLGLPPKRQRVRRPPRFRRPIHGAPISRFRGPHGNKLIAPANRFRAPVNRFRIPINRFGVPVNRFGVPINRFGVPINQFATPNRLQHIHSQPLIRPRYRPNGLRRKANRSNFQLRPRTGKQKMAKELRNRSRTRPSTETEPQNIQSLTTEKLNQRAKLSKHKLSESSPNDKQKNAVTTTTLRPHTSTGGTIFSRLRQAIDKIEPRVGKRPRFFFAPNSDSQDKSIQGSFDYYFEFGK